MNSVKGEAETRVCIFGESIAGALDGDVVGGAELQAALLARSLVNDGMSVTIVDPQVVGDRTTADGIEVREIPGWNGGIRGIRMFLHRIPGLIRVCRKARPTIYYTRGSSFIFLALEVLARVTHARFILALASDLDVGGFWKRYTSFYRNNSGLWDWISMIIPNHLTANIILKHAHIVLVQHPGQAANLKRPCAEVPNILSDDVFQVPPTPRSNNILLVGTIGTQKGIREFIPVIKELPGITFEFVGSPAGKDGPRIVEQLKQCPNVILRGWLPRAETLKRIAAARVLLNVSSVEGFPNSILESLALGTPILSLNVDPGGVIGRYGLGLVCNGDIGLLVKALQSAAYAVDPAVLIDYVRVHHSKEVAARMFRRAVFGETACGNHQDRARRG